MGIASPFFQSLPINIPWIEPSAPCAHPLDDGTAVLLKHSIEATAANVDSSDRRSYRALFDPLVRHFAQLAPELLRPIQHLPQHPFLLARFGLSALLPAASLAGSRFSGTRVRVLFAGTAAHSVLSLESPGSAATALVLMIAGHSSGWPIVHAAIRSMSRKRKTWRTHTPKWKRGRILSDSAPEEKHAARTGAV